MTEDIVLPDRPQDPLIDPPGVPGPAQDPLVRGDPMLDALERSIEKPLGPLVSPKIDAHWEDPIGKALSRVENSVVGVPSLPEIVQEQPAAASTPQLPLGSGDSASPPAIHQVRPAAQAEPAPRLFEEPPARREHPLRPPPGRAGRIGTGVARRGSPVTDLFARHLERRTNRRRSQLTLSGMVSCPDRGFDLVERTQCEACPQFLAPAEGRARECQFWRQAQHDSRQTAGGAEEEPEKYS